MKKFGIIILSLIILMSGFVFALTPSPQVEVLAPNGGETFAIGNTIVINWDFDYLDINELPKEYTLGISLVDGPTPGQVTALNPIPKDGIYKWKISEHIFQGDAGMSLQPGKYKLELILYDGMPCLGYCPREYPQPNILSKDKSDDYFDIIKSGEREQLITIPTEFSLEKGESAKVTNYQDMKIQLLGVDVCPPNALCIMADSAKVKVTTPGGCNIGTVESPTVESPNNPRCLGPPAFENEYTLYEGKKVDVLGTILGLNNVKVNRGEFKIAFGVDNSNNKPPVITVMSGPTDLKVNEIGKWSIEAYDPDGKYLKYSVDWGENIVYPGSSASIREISQEATFTYKYSSPGKYTVVFTVTDEDGGKAQSSISVNVGDYYDKWEEFSLEEDEIKTLGQGIKIKWEKEKRGSEYDIALITYIDGSDAIPVDFLKIGNVKFLPNNIGRLKLIDIWTIKTIPVQYVANFGIKFEKTPSTCSACMNGKPTGEYDENGCMIFECPPIIDCENVKCPGAYYNTALGECVCPICGNRKCEGSWEKESCSEDCKQQEECKTDSDCPFPSIECIGARSICVAGECKETCKPVEEKECPQLGYREKGRYCNINDAWEEQRNGGEYCNNDFECSSNFCLDSQCTEPGFWTKLSKWLAKFLVNPN